METKSGDPPTRGHPVADHIAASLHIGTPKKAPLDKIASKLEVEHDIWARSGVLELLMEREAAEKLR